MREPLNIISRYLMADTNAQKWFKLQSLKSIFLAQIIFFKTKEAFEVNVELYLKLILFCHDVFENGY